MKKFTSLKLILFFIFQLSIFISCADWFQDKVPMNSDTNNMTLEDFFYKEKVIDSLDVPAQVFVSQGDYADRIAINWTEIKYATSYRIERAVVSADLNGEYKLPEESDYEVRVNAHYSTNYSDLILTTPKATSEEYSKHYFYKITAENKSLGIESDPTDPNNTATRGEGWLFSTPKTVEADKGKSTSDIKITWSSVNGAVSYNIYRSENSNGTGMELIGSVRGNETLFTNSVLSNEQGTEFYYRIRAVNSRGNESTQSSIAMGYSLKEGAPATPDNVTVVDGFATSKENIKITWDEVAPSSENATISYSLYKTSSIESVYTLVKKDITETSFIDSSNLKSGIYYYYYVQAVAYDSAKQETLKSAFSEKTDNSYGFLLSAPSEFSVEDSSIDGKVKLVWSPSIGSNIEDFDDKHSNIVYKYNIYYSDAEKGTYSLLLEKQNGELNSDGYYYLDVDKKDFYEISAINTNNLENESNRSSPAAPTPAAPKNVIASKTKIFANGLTPNKNNVYPVQITWQKPDNDNPFGYIVYRSTKAESGFRKITDSPISQTNFIDSNETAKSGVLYYYKVVSVNSLGQGKKGNNPQDDLSYADGTGLSKINSVGYGALTLDQWFREYNKTVMNSQKKLTLMHKPNDMDKLGSESVNGNISGTLSYKASIAGLGAEIVMPYNNYADFYINDDEKLGVYFCLTGNNDTSSNMSANGKMSGTVVCTGMYPGSSNYNNLEIKGGAAGGGFYGVVTKDLEGNELSVITNQDKDKKQSYEKQVHWLVGEEGRK